MLNSLLMGKKRLNCISDMQRKFIAECILAQSTNSIIGSQQPDAFISQL